MGVDLTETGIHSSARSTQTALGERPMRAIEEARKAPRASRASGAIAGAVFCAMALAGGEAGAQSYPGQSERCQDLERQLVSEWQRGHSPQEAVARIDQQLEQLTRDRRTMEAEAEKRDCYEDLFIFGRSLRRTRACIQLDGDIERIRRDISNLRQQREAMTNSARRRFQASQICGRGQHVDPRGAGERSTLDHGAHGGGQAHRGAGVNIRRARGTLSTTISADEAWFHSPSVS
jgi:hypothetical protein